MYEDTKTVGVEVPPWKLGSWIHDFSLVHDNIQGAQNLMEQPRSSYVQNDTAVLLHCGTHVHPGSTIGGARPCAVVCITIYNIDDLTECCTPPQKQNTHSA